MAEDNGAEILTVRIPKSDSERFRESAETVSGKLRNLIVNCNEVEDELELRDDLQVMQCSILRMYRNAIQKNILTMEKQLEEIDDLLEDFEDEDSDSEVLVEINLDMMKKNL